MFARSFGVLLFFAIAQGVHAFFGIYSTLEYSQIGLFGGVFWSTCAPVSAIAVGVQDLGSAFRPFF